MQGWGEAIPQQERTLHHLAGFRVSTGSRGQLSRWTGEDGGSASAPGRQEGQAGHGGAVGSGLCAKMQLLHCRVLSQGQLL